VSCLRKPLYKPGKIAYVTERSWHSLKAATDNFNLVWE